MRGGQHRKKQYCEKTERMSKRKGCKIKRGRNGRVEDNQRGRENRQRRGRVPETLTANGAQRNGGGEGQSKG